MVCDLHVSAMDALLLCPLGALRMPCESGSNSSEFTWHEHRLQASHLALHRPCYLVALTRHKDLLEGAAPDQLPMLLCVNPM